MFVLRTQRVIACAGAFAAALALAACKSEEKIVEYKPFFAGLPGVEGTENATVRSSHGNLSSPKPEDRVLTDEPLDPSLAAVDPLVIENVDGTKTLIIRSIRHVMTHIERRLDEGDEGGALLLEQVVAQSTKDEYEKNGKDQQEIIKYLQGHRRDIAVLFSRLPFAEHTPGVFLDKQARNRFVLKLPPLAQKGSDFTELWVELEHGTWKFLWVK